MLPPKSIVHLDADAFFASVEQAADSRLRGKPIAVGGEKRGIIASASYEARKFGVYTPMPTVRARKLCPKLIVLPGDYDRYEHFSKWMFSYSPAFFARNPRTGRADSSTEPLPRLWLHRFRPEQHDDVADPGDQMAAAFLSQLRSEFLLLLFEVVELHLDQFMVF
jgi:hypothetical protein